MLRGDATLERTLGSAYPARRAADLVAKTSAAESTGYHRDASWWVIGRRATIAVDGRSSGRFGAMWW